MRASGATCPQPPAQAGRPSSCRRRCSRTSDPSRPSSRGSLRGPQRYPPPVGGDGLPPAGGLPDHHKQNQNFFKASLITREQRQRPCGTPAVWRIRPDRPTTFDGAGRAFDPSWHAACLSARPAVSTSPLVLAAWPHHQHGTPAARHKRRRRTSPGGHARRVASASAVAGDLPCVG